MKVRRIRHKNIAEEFGAVDIELPDIGLVLVTGKNGSGKSTGTLEAVSTAFFGTTVVTDPLWREDTAGMIEGTLGNGIVATRRVTKGGTAKFALSGEGFAEEVTGTKAKEHLSKFLPSHKVWVNSCVLSSQTLGAFSRAADKARKAMVEELLGLSYLDVAFKAADKAFKAAKTTEYQLNIAKVGAEGKANTAAATIQALSATLSAPDDAAIQALRDRHAALDTQKTDNDSDLREAHAALTALQGQSQTVMAGILAVQTKFDHLTAQKLQMQGGACPTCGQAIAGQDTTAIDASIQEARAALDTAMAENSPELAMELTRLLQLVQGLSQKSQTLSGQLHTIVAEGHAAKRAQTEATTLTERVRVAQLDGVAKETEKMEAAVAHRDQLTEMEVLDHARIALGVKGVRTYLLPQALEAITNVANAWLATIYGPTLTLRIYEEKDKVQLKIYGRGRGTYNSLSLGFQRRVDLALLLAFGEVARQSFGLNSVTLFCDEPFLGFDSEGIETVSNILNSLASEHCVVAITNQMSVAKAVRPDMHYNVANGDYKRVS
jgi:DNA repair exonuclease SbcCD ATPase subunit